MEPTFVMGQELSEFGDNKYLLVNVAALRARQINDGVEIYVKSRSNHPLQIALEEIAGDHIEYSIGAEVEEPEVEEKLEGIFRFDDIVDLEGGFDLEDESAFDFEDLDIEEEIEEAGEIPE